MSIKILKRELFGGGTIFESSTTDTVADAIKEMGAKPNLSDADLSDANLYGANLNYANLSRANLSYALLSWQSHDCIAEILRQSAGEDTQKRMVAGLVLVSRDWCWDKFLSLEIGEPLRDWALTTLSGWAWKEDNTAPELLTNWMQERGISRPVRPSEQTETNTPAEGGSYQATRGGR